MIERIVLPKDMPASLWSPVGDNMGVYTVEHTCVYTIPEVMSWNRLVEVHNNNQHKISKKWTVDKYMAIGKDVYCYEFPKPIEFKGWVVEKGEKVYVVGLVRFIVFSRTHAETIS